ncbi:hypothetical protein LJR228_001470 [Mesorhizobium caraganae]
MKHISPLSWEHINLTDIYTWDAELQMPDGYDETRPENHVFLAHSRFIALGEDQGS